MLGTMNNFTVHIVSERLLFRKTFSKLLAVLDPELECAEHVESYHTLSNVPSAQDGGVLVDCGTMDQQAVMECMLHCLSIQSEPIVILVLDEQDDEIVDAGMAMGAMGVVIKASPPQVIVDYLQRILTGERCRPAPAKKVPREEIPEHLRRQLSARQQKMLRAIMGGQSISATAQQLNMTHEKVITEMRQVIATIRGR